jgi:hypothetical protein
MWTRALGDYSHAEGFSNISSCYSSHAEGQYTCATSYAAHSEGRYTKATGDTSHAEGFNAKAYGDCSHAEGHTSYSCGRYSHAEGAFTIASGCTSHSQGASTHACGNCSHAGGSGNATNVIAGGNASFIHSMNCSPQTAGHGALANNSAILGGTNHNIEVGNTGAVILGGNLIKLTGTDYIGTTAVGKLALITGLTINASSDEVLVRNTTTGVVDYVSKASIGGGGGSGATAADNGLTLVEDTVILGGSLTGDTTVDLNDFGIVFGNETATATGSHAVAIGNKTNASGNFGSFAAGYGSVASGISSMALGNYACAGGQGSMAIGSNTKADRCFTFAAGCLTEAICCSSAAFGRNTKALGDYSFAQGYATCAISSQDHAEGVNTCAAGSSSHAEGACTISNGFASHAEGCFTISHQNASHAQGFHTYANAVASHAGGAGTATRRVCANACAAFNHSSNDGGAIEFYGAHANFSAILGGENHNIAATETRAVILGGCAINLSGGSYVDTTAVPNLAIISGLTNNASSDEVLVRNTTTGVIDYVSKASIGGGGATASYPNTSWVSLSGSNSTGSVGDITKPFATFGCALSLTYSTLSPTADNRALICVASGLYPNVSVGSCNYVDWYFDHGSYVCGTGGLAFTNVESNVWGYGCFRRNDGLTGFPINLNNVTGYTQFHSVKKCATNGAALNVSDGIQNINFGYAYNGCTTGSLISAVNVDGGNHKIRGKCVVTYGGNSIVLGGTLYANVCVDKIVATGSTTSALSITTLTGSIEACTPKIVAGRRGVLVGTTTGNITWGGSLIGSIAAGFSPIDFISVGSNMSIGSGSVIETCSAVCTVNAGSAQTVKILGQTVANTGVHANVTTCIGTFTTDSGVQVVY